MSQAQKYVFVMMVGLLLFLVGLLIYRCLTYPITGLEVVLVLLGSVLCFLVYRSKGEALLLSSSSMIVLPVIVVVSLFFGNLTQSFAAFAMGYAICMLSIMTYYIYAGKYEG